MGRLGGVTALRADGTEFPVEASISSALLGERRLYTVIMRDVTARVAAERRITSLGRLYAALARSNAAIVRIGDWRELCSTVCRIIVDESQVAAAVVRMPDHDRGRLVPFAKHGGAAGRVGRLEVPLSESGHPLIRAYRSGRAELVRDIRAEPTMVLSHQAAQEFGLHAALMLPLRTSSGVIGVLSVVAEQSDHFDGELGQLLAELADDLVFAHDKLTNEAAVRENEQRIREINASLEARIAERTAALTQANRTLDANNRNLESFCYSVAHDLRAPLRSMSGFAQLLKMDLEVGRTSELGAHADRIVASAARMNALIDGLLAVARVSHGALARETVDLSRMVADVIHDTPDAGRVRFEVAELPAALGDRSALRQLWTNLISNAVKYSARQPAPAVMITVEQSGDEAVFTVRDNGVGFNAAEAGRLFGVFQRLHTQADFEGTGVGLAIVQRIVERHDGRIWADSVPGEGAAFHFTLPASRLAAPSAAIAPTASA
jgi:signal transduction histidine kinase